MAGPGPDPKGPLAVIGSTGLKQYSGFVVEEFLRELQGDRWRRVIKEMADQDPIVGAILFAIEMLLRKVTWNFSPGDESPEAKEESDYFDSCLHDMENPWEDTLAELLSFLPHGFSFHEVNYKVRGGESEDATRNSKFDDGRIGWRSFAGRAQDSLWKWEFDSEDQNKLVGMWQIAPPYFNPVMIPLAKALHFRTTVKKGNPEGKSILRNAYRPWYFKKNIENIEGVGIERDLAGLPVAYVPPELLDPASGPDKVLLYKAVKDIVTNIRRDQQEGVVFPMSRDEQGNKLYELSLLTTGGTRQFNTSEVITRYDQRMAMVVLADFILIGHEAVGSKALNVSKTDTFVMACGAWLDMIADEINTREVPRLRKLNGFSNPVRPQLVHGEIKDVDLEKLGKFITAISGAGMPLFPNPALEKFVLETAGLPAPAEEQA